MKLSSLLGLEVSAARRFLRSGVPVLGALTAAVTALPDPRVPREFAAVLVVVMGMYSSMVAHEDGAGGRWALLRSLPVPPEDLVRARFLATAAMLLAVAGPGLLTLAAVGAVNGSSAFTPFAGSAAWMWAVTFGTTLAQVGYLTAAYFRLGYRRGYSLLRGVVTMGLVFHLTDQASQSTSPWVSAHPIAALAVVLGGALLFYLLCYQYSASHFPDLEIGTEVAGQ